MWDDGAGLPRRDGSPVRMAKSTVISRLKKKVDFTVLNRFNCSNDYCPPGVNKNIQNSRRQTHTDLKSFQKP